VREKEKEKKEKKKKKKKKKQHVNNRRFASIWEIALMCLPGPRHIGSVNISTSG
jgi:hypothetical protein